MPSSRTLTCSRPRSTVMVSPSAILTALPVKSANAAVQDRTLNRMAAKHRTAALSLLGDSNTLMLKPDIARRNSATHWSQGTTTFAEREAPANRPHHSPADGRSGSQATLRPLKQTPPEIAA